MPVYQEKIKKAILEFDKLSIPDKEQLLDKLKSNEKIFVSPNEYIGVFSIIYENEEAKNYMSYNEIINNIYKISSMAKIPEIIDSSTVIVYKLNSHFYFKILLNEIVEGKESISIKDNKHSFSFGTTLDNELKEYFYRKMIKYNIMNKTNIMSKNIIEILQKYSNNSSLKDRVESFCNKIEYHNKNIDSIDMYESNKLLIGLIDLTNILKVVIKLDDDNISDTDFNELEIIVRNF